MNKIAVVSAFVLAVGSLAAAELPVLKSKPLFSKAGLDETVAEKGYVVPATAIPDHGAFTVAAEFDLGRLPDARAIDLFSQRTGQTGWALNATSFKGWGNPLTLDVNGVPYRIGSLNGHYNDGKSHTVIVTARKGVVAVYVDGGLMSRVYAVITPNLEPLKVGGFAKTRLLAPVEGAKLRSVRVWGGGEEYYAKGEKRGFAAGKVGGHGWMLSVPANGDNAALPSVLYYGDSISHGYTSPLTARIGAKARLYHWSGFLYGVGYSGPAFVAATEYAKPDLIIFNNGLHSLRENWQKASDDEIRAVYRGVLNAFRKTAPKAKICYLNTTPHMALRDSSGRVAGPGDLNFMVERLNRLADEVMAEEKTEVIDLYPALLARPDLSSGDGYHWKRDAYDLIAAEIEKRFDTLGKGVAK